MKRDVYADVTNKILAQLETGAAPWVKPWSATPGLNVPCNAVTNRPYSGCNVVLLWMAQSAGYRTPRFLTFKQATELGGHVRKGEHGHKVFFVKQLSVKDDKGDGTDPDTKIVPMLREYTVFNVDQCEKLPERVFKLGAVKQRNPDERDATIDEFIRATRADFREEHTDQACYRVGPDYVQMPKFEGFRNAAAFYNVAFHELGHWTGAGSRLARDFGKRFGDQRYAAEELVAELCAAFLCAEFELDGELRHAGYIQSWISLLKSDSRAFFTAASKAQQAADYMRGLALASPSELAA